MKGEDGKIIRRPKAHKNEKDSYRIVRALHIEVPRAHKDYIYKRLQVIFSARYADSLGRRLLMVPIIRDTTPSHKIVKITHLIKKQTQFLTKIKTAKLWDFTDIDTTHPTLEVTARDMLMDLETLDGTSTRVFLGVDYNAKDECYEVTFAKYLDTQVRDILAQLPSLLAYLYTDDVLELMTTAAQERALDAPWDEKAICAFSKEDREMDKMVQESQQMGLDDDSDDSSTQFQFEFEDPDKIAKSQRLFQKTSTNDSISTIETRDIHMNENKTIRDDTSLNTKNPSSTKKTRTIDSNDNVRDDVSALGDKSTTTSSSRIEAVESIISSLHDMMHAFFKSQNFNYQPTNLEPTLYTEMADEDSAQHREAAQIVPETPGADKAPGDVL